jgi:hypothetical protein
MSKKIKNECPYCKQEFYAYACYKPKFCSHSCRSSFYNKLRTKEKEKKECPVCHDLFEVTPVRTKYCSIKCRGLARRKPESEKKQYIPKEPKIKLCAVCGAEFLQTRGNVKYCLTCRKTEALKNARAYWQTEKYKEAHRRKAREWQKSNPLKTKAQYLAKKYSDQLNIIYDCPHQVEGKHRHHFDYSRPFDVLILCDSCHAAEHARLRSLSAQAVAI